MTPIMVLLMVAAASFYGWHRLLRKLEKAQYQWAMFGGAVVIWGVCVAALMIYG